MAVTGQTSVGFIATADSVQYFSPYVAQTPTVVSGGSPSGANHVDAYGGSRSLSMYLDLPWAGNFLWFHQRFKCGTMSYPPVWTFFGATGIGQCSLYVNSAGIFVFGQHSQNTNWGYGLAYGFIQIAEAANLPLVAGAWYSIYGEVTTHSSTGAFKLWLNDVQVFNLSNIDTRNDTWGGDYLGGMCLVQNAYLTDWVIGNNTSPNAAAPGELRVDCMMPNANGTDRANGGTNEMTRSTGSDDYVLVDETASSANTGDYVYADAAGERCSFNVAALTNTGGTIVAVSCTVYAQKMAAGPCSFKIYCLRGGTRYYSDAFYPTYGSWLYFAKVWDQDPSTSAAWTESNFNAAEFGTERIT